MTNPFPRRRRRVLPIVVASLLLALGSPARPQTTVTIARPTGGGEHLLLTADEVTGTLVSLIPGVRFLPVRLAGRARIDRLRPDRPSLREDGPAPRVRLPGAGSLYRIGKDGTTALLLEDGAGTPAVLLSTPDDLQGPRLDEWIAVDDGGTRALVATRPSAGGDVWLLDLATGNAQPLTDALPPLDVAGISLRLGSDTAWFVADNVLHRVALSPMPTVQQVALDVAATDVLVPELATTPDVTRTAILSEDVQGRHLHFVDATGTAVRLTTAVADIDAPTLDSPLGPRLLLDAGASHVAWRQTLGVPELFVQEIEQPSAAEQVTASPQYADTFDNVGILGFVGASLLFAVGELQLQPGDAMIDDADLFLLDTAVPGADPVNITQTSGLTAPPYGLPGTLEIFEVLFDPTGERILLRIDPTTGDEALLVSSTTTPGTLVDVVPPSEVPVAIEAAGDHVLAHTAFDGIGPGTLTLLPPGDDAVSLVAVPMGVTLDRFAEDRTGVLAAGVVSAGPGLELTLVVDLASGQLFVVWPKLFGVPPAQAFTPSGRLATGLGGAGGPYLFAAFDGFASGTVLHVGVGDGFPLVP